MATGLATTDSNLAPATEMTSLGSSGESADETTNLTTERKEEPQSESEQVFKELSELGYNKAEIEEALKACKSQGLLYNTEWCLYYLKDIYNQSTEFHSRPQLPKLTIGSVCLGLAPLLFIVLMAVFGVIVYMIAQSEITPAPTAEPTMSPTMKPSKSPFTLPPSLFPTMSPTSALEAFVSRRETFMDTALENGDTNPILAAYRGLPLNQTVLDDWRDKVQLSEKNADWTLIDLVRVLYLSDGSIDDWMLETVNQSAPFWVHSGDLVQFYWTENHMIMWESSAFLLKQKFPSLETDSGMYNRLVTFLQLKINHGWFILNTAIYFPYKMAALMNLADFSEDEMIKTLAMGALDVLLANVVRNTNSEGAFYPAQARSVDTRYNNADHWYTYDDVKCINLLTGLGPTASSSFHTPFIATTNTDNLINILGTYEETIDDTYYTGIEIANFSDLNSTNYPISNDDRIVFQLTAQLYWIPETVADTVQWITDYNLWNHSEFVDFFLFTDPVNYTGLTYEQLRPLTQGADMNEFTTVVYKDGPCMLSSFQEYNPYYLSQQQYPWAATTGTYTVWAKSGDGSGLKSVNVHLPRVIQSKNAALVMYDSTIVSAYAALLVGFGITDIANVSVRFPQSKFDESRTYGNWELGMEIGSNGIDGYVALRRDQNCTDAISDDMIVCDETKSAWALFVGSSTEYESFDGFESVVQNATYDDGNNILDIGGVTIDGGQ